MEQLFYQHRIDWPGVDTWLHDIEQCCRDQPTMKPSTWPESVHSSMLPPSGNSRRSLVDYADSSHIPTELIELLLPEVHAAARYFDLTSLGDAHLQEIWYNAYALGQWQNPHRHTGADTWLSGVYFAAFDADVHAATRFQHPGFRWNFDDLGWPACVTFQPPAQSGTVIIFPSEICHDVPANQSTKLRVTVSFNIGITVQPRGAYA